MIFGFSCIFCTVRDLWIVFVIFRELIFQLFKDRVKFACNGDFPIFSCILICGWHMDGAIS